MTTQTLQGLVEVIRGEVNDGGSACPPDVEAYYAATLRHVKHQKLRGGEIGARYESLNV